eukprot:m.317025 g.317025  ORF g.317025 m.317025 type:complete len:591 (+) comp27554_c0_seq1:336-2108(+)
MWTALAASARGGVPRHRGVQTGASMVVGRVRGGSLHMSLSLASSALVSRPLAAARRVGGRLSGGGTVPRCTAPVVCPGTGAAVATRVMGAIGGGHARWGSSKSDKPRPINVVEFDAVGKVRLSTFTHKQLRTELQLSRRFAALIDSTMSNRHPVIDVAGHGDSLIISLDATARVIVQTNRAMLMDPGTIAGERLAVMLQRAVTRSKDGDAETPFSPEGWVTDETTRFDLRVLEAVLRFMCTALDYELQVLTARVHEVLEELAVSATDEALQQLVPIKHSLAAFSVQVKEFKGSLEVNLTQPKELAQIENLRPPFEESDGIKSTSSRAIAARVAASGQHGDLAFEVMDEMYWTVDEIENETAQLMANIRASEEVLAITLDKTRNQLIKLNLVATTGAFVAAVGSMAASLFGMNLHVEEFTARALPDFPQDALFPTVTISILGASALFATGFVRWHTQLNRSQKHTVVAQGVIDRLHARYTDIESSAITRYGHKASLTKVEFIRVMVDLKLLLTSTEVDSLFVLLGGTANDTLNVDLLLSVLRQHAHANLVRVRPTDTAALDVMPPHVALSRMPLPTSRSDTGNKFFTIKKS